MHADTENVVANPRGHMRLAHLAHLAILVAVPLLVLSPPVQGDILIVPIGGGSPGASLGWALPAGARLVGVGPLPNSLVIRGARAALFVPALQHGALLLSGRFSGCRA